MIQTKRTTVKSAVTKKAPVKKRVVIPDTLTQKTITEEGEIKFKHFYKGNFLGKGGFAECYELIDSETKIVYAGKIIPRDNISDEKSRAKVSKKKLTQKKTSFFAPK